MNVFKHVITLNEFGEAFPVQVCRDDWNLSSEENREQLESLKNLFYYDGLKFEGCTLLGIEQDIVMLTWVFRLRDPGNQGDWDWEGHEIRKKFERWIDEWWDDESRFTQRVAVNIGWKRVVISHFQEG